MNYFYILFYIYFNKLNKLKIHKVLINFNYILFFNIFLIGQPNISKSFSLILLFFFFNAFWNHTYNFNILKFLNNVKESLHF